MNLSLMCFPSRYDWITRKRHPIKYDDAVMWNSVDLNKLQISQLFKDET